MEILKWISITFIIANIGIIIYNSYKPDRKEKISDYILMILYFIVLAYLIWR